MAAAGALRFPVLAVNDALTKWEYDNVYGTGQSTIDGILRATGVLLAGKTFVVGGFGHVGRGVALRARGMGADVIVTEVRPTSALIAAMEGYRVLPMDEAAPLGDIFCTASGMRDLIVARHLAAMKDGAILCNAGHFDCEINLGDLRSLARATRRVREHVERFELDDARSVYLLGEGRVVNLAAADGNPSEIMDLTFATHLLALLELARDAVALDIGVHRLPSELDERVARLKLETLGLRTDSLSAAQAHYDEDFSSTSRLPSASSL
jgi:adenosylhomocysteinase